MHRLFLFGLLIAALLYGFRSESIAAPQEGVTPPKQSKRITQAQRQAAAERAKVKGFVAPKVTDPSTPQMNMEKADDTVPKNGGPSK